MKFSVITVTYNSAATLEDTIRSVAMQNYPGLEHIIVDGGSTDGTLDIIERFRIHISKFVSEPDRGLYDALNKGIGMAEGDVVAILHSDDIYTGPDVISNYAHIFETMDCDAVYSDLYYVSRNNSNKVIRRWKSGSYKPGAFLNGWMPPHPTFMAKRSLYVKFGGFDTDFKTSADYELMLRFVHRHKINLAYLPKFTVKMKMGGQSNESLGNRIFANKEDKKAWAANQLQPRFYTLYVKPLRKLLQFFT